MDGVAMVVVNLLGVAFGAGILWQKVAGVEKRLERIEKILNGRVL